MFFRWFFLKFCWMKNQGGTVFSSLKSGGGCDVYYRTVPFLVGGVRICLPRAGLVWFYSNFGWRVW